MHKLNSSSSDACDGCQAPLCCWWVICCSKRTTVQATNVRLLQLSQHHFGCSETKIASSSHPGPVPLSTQHSSARPTAVVCIGDALNRPTAVVRSYAVLTFRKQNAQLMSLVHLTRHLVAAASSVLVCPGYANAQTLPHDGGACGGLTLITGAFAGKCTEVTPAVVSLI